MHFQTKKPFQKVAHTEAIFKQPHKFKNNECLHDG